MSLFLSPLLRQRFFDSNGLPLTGGQLFSYAAGTTTPQDTFVNSTGTVNTNPVVLDSQGYSDVWIDPTLSYKFVLEDSLGNIQWSIDNVSSPFEVTSWSATISYSMGEIVQDSSGFGLFYVSLTNNNVNNALTSVSNWRRLGGNIRTVSTSQTSPTLLATDELIRSNSTSGNLIHTLPLCSSTSIGTKITVKDVGTGGNSTQIKGSGTDTIDGNNTWSISLISNASGIFENNGTSWDSVYSVVPNSVITVMLAAQSVTAAKIANSTITGTQMASSINIPGKSVQEAGSNLVVSGANAINSLAIVRGYVLNTGAISVGEGFSITKTSTGVFTITFTVAFSDFPVVTATSDSQNGGTGNGVVRVVTLSTSAVGLNIEQGGVATAMDSGFSFIAIGQRA